MPLLKRTFAATLAAACGWLANAQGQTAVLDGIGVTLLRSETTNLNGADIRVAQVEAEMATNPPAFEVPPGAVGQPVSLFTYISSSGTANTYPNSEGAASSHAQSVAGYFYGLPGGVATNVGHVDNYDANAFISATTLPVFSASLPATNINAPVVNQSFVFTTLTPSEQQTVDATYDNYAAQYQTLFVSGVGNGGAVLAPATSYNGIGVADYGFGGGSSVGPTVDNGRAKPDITALAGATSFSTPQVSGAAAVLMQAGLRGDGGSASASAADIRTVKALLLNGAVKPRDWASRAPLPLDPRYGAGVLNLFNSYEQLAGQEHGFIASSSVSSGGAHPSTGDAGTINSLHGWDFNSISSASAFLVNPAMDGVNHYYFEVINAANKGTFSVSITLVWNRQQNQSAINNLSLFLFDTASGRQLATSASLVDNVQHIFLEQLPQGRYDLQVLKSAANSVTDTETYALAFEFFQTSLTLAQTAAGTAISWPVYPAGFVLESTMSLVAPISWTTNNPAPVVVNHRNQVSINATNTGEFFRLARP